MNADLSIPPLLDPPPGHLAARKNDILAEIAGHAETRRRRPTFIWPIVGTPFRLGVLAGAAVATAAVLALLLTPGGRSNHTGLIASPGSQNSSGSANGPGPVDWSTPLIDGLAVSSVSQAAPDLAFQPVVPSRTPSAIFETPPVTADRADRELALVYDNPSGGEYNLIEKTSDNATTASLASWAQSCSPKTGCEASETMIPLNGGHQGLLIQGVTTGIFWVQGGVLFDVFGPTGPFTVDQAESIANDVIGAAAGSS